MPRGTPGLPYSSTTVSVSRTQHQIFELVRKFGATDFAFTNVHDPDRSAVVFTVQFSEGQKVMVKLEARTKGILRVMAKKRGLNYVRWEPSDRLKEQASMMAWRVLHDEMKARLVAVQYGVIDFVRAFMSDMVSEVEGETFGDKMQRRIEGGMDPARLLEG